MFLLALIALQSTLIVLPSSLYEQIFNAIVLGKERICSDPYNLNSEVRL